jgi:hypothetical protein
MTAVVTAGWTDFGGQSRKFHYIPADDSNALCRKWCLSPLVSNARERAHLQPDTGKPSPDDCKACRRKLDAMTATASEDQQGASGGA